MADAEHFWKNVRPKSLWARYHINRWLDRIQIWCYGSLVISDDLINFWKIFIKREMADRGYFEKMSVQKSLWVVVLIFLMIWLTFGKNPLKTRWPMEDILKKKPPEELVGAISFAVVLSPCPIRSDRQTTSLTLTTGAPYSCTNGRGCEQHDYSLWRHGFTDCSVEVTLRSDCLGCLNWPGRRGVLSS